MSAKPVCTTMRVDEIASAAGGIVLAGAAARVVRADRISTDTRTMRARDLFIALTGPRYDANRFAGEVLRRGAMGVVVGRGRGKELARKARRGTRAQAVIEVGDTTKAYNAIAQAYRKRFKIPVIAVTGSNGKTTTKDMIAHILGARFNIHKSEGTKNNNVGLPATLLGLTSSTEACVVELGMNHRGEIRYLAGIARPTIGVITTIGPSHAEQLGSVGNIFKAKCELLYMLSPGARAVLNGDDRYLARVKPGRYAITRYGFGKENDISASDACWKKNAWNFTVNGRHRFRLRLIGRHNISNALAAIAVARIVGVSYREIERRLATFASGSMRLEPVTVKGVRFINDAYNANPLSFESAIAALGECTGGGRKYVVAGDMCELGPRSEAYHAAVGALVAREGMDGFIAVGRLAKHAACAARNSGMKMDSVKWCASPREAARHLGAMVRARDVVLVKGSRAMHMEKVVERYASLGSQKR